MGNHVFFMEAAFSSSEPALIRQFRCPLGETGVPGYPLKLPRKGCQSPLEKREEIWYNVRIGGTESSAGGMDGTHT